jgi:predicted transcriptional regulator
MIAQKTKASGRIVLRCSDDLRRELDQAARSRGEASSVIARAAIREYLQSAGFAHGPANAGHSTMGGRGNG